MTTARIFGSFLRRDWVTAKSYRLNFVLDLINTFLGLALFFFLGRLVDASRFGQETGLRNGYFSFVVIGIVLLRLVQTGISSFASKIRSEQTSGTLEAVLATPASNGVIILASAGYEFVQATLSALIALGLAVGVFGMRMSVSFASVTIAIWALVATIVFFACIGISVAAFTLVFKQPGALLGLITAGLALVGGAYFPIRLLPPPIHFFSQLLPFTWSLDLIRGALLENRLEPLELALLTATSLVALPITLRLFSLALKHARRKGTLSHF